MAPGSIRLVRVNATGDGFIELAPSDDVTSLLTAADKAGIRGVLGVSPTNLLPNDCTVATLPSAVINARKYQWVTDLFGGAGDYVLSDGLNWKPVRPLWTTSMASQTMTLQPLASPPTVVLTGTIGTGLTHAVSLGTANAYKGARFLVSRRAGGLGAMSVAGLSIALNAWTQHEFDGAAWVQTASGGLL